MEHINIFENLTSKELFKELTNVFSSYSLVLDSQYIANDGDVEINEIKRFIKECKTFNWEYILAIRHHGVEGTFSCNWEYIKNRVKDFSDNIACSITVSYMFETKRFNLYYQKEELVEKK